MARKHEQKNLEVIYRQVESTPGKKPGFIAWILGINRGQMNRRLPMLEEQGYLLYEDDDGGLWPFGKRSE